LVGHSVSFIEWLINTESIPGYQPSVMHELNLAFLKLSWSSLWSVILYSYL
jgi:hypothetical protein